MPFNWEKVSRDSEEYQVCSAAMIGGGFLAGGAVGGAGAALTAGLSVPALYAAGGALGWAVGYIACPYIAPKVKEKLTVGHKLTQNETQNAVEAMYKNSGAAKADEEGASKPEEI